MINKAEEEYVERLAQDIYGDGTKTLTIPMLRHFLDGAHVFAGIDSYLPIWHETLNPERSENEFGRCEFCNFTPRQVSKLPDTFWKFDFLTFEEATYLNHAKAKDEFWTAFDHLSSFEHDWYQYDSPRNPLCNVCKLRCYEVSHTGQIDAIFFCDSISITARPGIMDEFEDGSLVLGSRW